VTTDPHFVGDHLLCLGAYEFHCTHPVGYVPPGRIPVEKERDLVEAYIHTCGQLRPERIVELGIYKGGSTVLLSELVDPQKLVAVDLTETPVALLDDYVAARGRTERVRPHYGVDQSDRPRLRSILETEFGGEPLDLVIDDASHLYAESVASFEVVFPLVRPGGLVLLEDWRWEHEMVRSAGAAAPDAELSEEAISAIGAALQAAARGERARVVPMSRLVVELVLARAASGDAVADVTIGPHWAAVRRGPAALDPSTFRVADIVEDHFGVLAPAGG
jgi:predicted O-methyltransferase YrrM